MTHIDTNEALAVQRSISSDAAMQPKRVLIMTSVEAEREAVLRGLRHSSTSAAATKLEPQAESVSSQPECTEKNHTVSLPQLHFDVVLAGVGSAAAAVHTTRALLASPMPYDLVINAGIAGGFKGRAEIGTLVVASEIICADLGAESEEGFISIDKLGFGSAYAAAAKPYSAHLAKALGEAQLSAVHASILTLSTVTGTRESAEELLARFPEAAAEAMEGFGVAAAAEAANVPVIELRAISNPIGPRDRSAWRIGDALRALEAACVVLKEVFA